MKILSSKKPSKNEIEDPQAPSAVSRLASWTSFSFVDLAGELMDLKSLWFATRKWNSTLLMLPIVLMLLALGSVVAVGKLSTNRSKVKWYVDLADKEIKLATEKPPNTELPPNPKDNAEFVDMLFRRVLQLENNNKRALFHVALQMSRYGQVSAARPIMESLAPTKFGGYEPAHAWVAGDMIQKAQSGESINSETLKHHLKYGTMRTDVNPVLLVVYAQLLQRDDQITEAEQVLRKAAKFEPRLLLRSIATYVRNGMVGQAKSAADLLVDSVKDKWTGEKADENLLLAAQGYVLTDRLDMGIELMQSGLKLRPQSPLLRRALSDAMRIKFRTTLITKDSQVQVNLEYINFAIALDPTNIAIREELEMLSELGIGQNDSTCEALRAQIAVNGSSFIARLILAESSLRGRDFPSAVNQYEVLLAEFPNMTLAINNLAMIYTFLDVPRNDEALSIIDRAIEISPDVAEFHDTRAEVLIASGRKSEAVASFEDALKKDPERENTRVKLIALLDELSNLEQAQQQRDQLAQVRNNVLERQEKLRAAQLGERKSD
ncbi:MAG: tetratricopeptide repeat protein [Pirellula sp.]|nr:tetratricopeptide repeat protein [Pirellula sp.]